MFHDCAAGYFVAFRDWSLGLGVLGIPASPHRSPSSRGYRSPLPSTAFQEIFGFQEISELKMARRRMRMRKKRMKRRTQGVYCLVA
jgi:hypothetical protein